MITGSKQHPVERRAVTIDDVDIPNLLAHVKDKTGGRFMVSFRHSGGIASIPKQGQAWIVERNRNASNDWYFKEQRHSNAEYRELVDSSQPGDARIKGDRVLVRTHEIDIENPDSLTPTVLTMEAGDVTLEVTSLKLSTTDGTPHALGATRMERRVTVGATTTWLLANTPVDIQTIMLFDNGALVDPNGLSLIAKTVSFPSIAISHTLVVYYQTLAS